MASVASGRGIVSLTGSGIAAPPRQSAEDHNPESDNAEKNAHYRCKTNARPHARKRRLGDVTVSRVVDLNNGRDEAVPAGRNGLNEVLAILTVS